MDLIINNKLINTPILTILKQLKEELPNDKLRDINDKHNYISITCPHHNNGMENHPSCSIYCGQSPTIQYGVTNCFTCGFKGPLYHFIAECFDTNDEFGKEWLLARFGNTLIKNVNYISPILKPIQQKIEYIDESILNKFQSYHPYMTKRKLTPDIIEKFQIKYDPECKCIIFPVYDKNNRLIMLTKRSVENKKFYLDESKEKPIYLLNYILNNNIKTVYVCESQINALTCISYGKPAIALLGTGYIHQYNILKKTNINHFILALDGDNAGIKGIEKFILNMPLNVIIDIAELPKGKDINDLTKEEFDKLKIIDKSEWLKNHK